MKVLTDVNQLQIVKCWDKIAKVRSVQIESGKDISYHHILIPALLELSALSDFSRVVDIGCGTGILTKKLAAKAKSIVGIDMSKNMIEIAKAKTLYEKDISFVQSDIEDYSSHFRSSPFTLAIANMTLMNTLRLTDFLRATASILSSNAHFIITITHPWFWPMYWGYANKEWFDYKKETLIEDVFRISLDQPINGPKTIHIHRPLEQYSNDLSVAGFRIEEIREPMPDSEITRKYPKPWVFPRFLAMKCSKIVE